MPQDTATTDLDAFMAEWVAEHGTRKAEEHRNRLAATKAAYHAAPEFKEAGLAALVDAFNRAFDAAGPHISDAALDGALRSWFGIKPGDRRGDWSDAERESMRAAILAALTVEG